jgi:hypothetical protein
MFVSQLPASVAVNALDHYYAEFLFLRISNTCESMNRTGSVIQVRFF